MCVPHIARLQFESVVADAEGAAAINFRPDRTLAFTAGQLALWQIPGGRVRPFTIASAPEEELVTLGTSLASGTRLKRALGSPAPGDPIRLLGPLSGSPAFVADTTRALRKQAVDASVIRRDRFWGARTATPEPLALVSA